MAYKRLFTHAILCSALISGCAQGSGSSSTIPAESQVQSQVSGNAASGSPKAWALGLSDSCPSRAEKIAVSLAALDSSYKLITGSYNPAIKLTDTDKSGATHLSISTITKASEKIDLTYSGAAIGSFRIIPSLGPHKGTGLAIVPHSTCINAKPSIVKIETTGKGTMVALSGSAKPPFDLRSLDSITGYGCDKYIRITRKTAASYQLSATSPPASGACAVYAVPNNGHSKDYFQINVLLIK